ncbi:twin-arginine translocation signal domain-containing protein [Dermatobacter hominis]|uniref:twin-arginine translocation signal domain-containing protein n=1 Tax=Dermatobacter hominis TaxID=2884263 RepID=UPI001D10C1BE|nr:twin-arginine translocation signal domain-containing protein [Dermatobacter hominis]UDY33964.1 twin-arginine translocation signal domain-containing protein [Dermatobacter hominis]
MSDVTPGDNTTSRRSALKKAAAAGAVGAAAWAAPKVEGFSIAPDYASAGTSTSIDVTLRLNGNGPGLAGANNFMNAAPSPAYTITQNGPSDSQAVIITAPLPGPTPATPVGNAVWTFPSGQDTDGPAISGGTVAFNVDGPHNRCRVTSSNTGWQGTTGGRPTLGNPVTPAPVPNNPGTFSQTISIPAGGESPYYNPASAINFIEVRIQCT